MTRSVSSSNTVLPHQPDNTFAAKLAENGQSLTRAKLTTLQLNLGKMCNLACNHCHVEAGPTRTEVMSWQTMEQILAWLETNARAAGIKTVDMTGGSPEMNPHFRELVVALKQRGLHLLDRCNPTILQQPGYEEMHLFLAEHGVEIVASLPCYLEDNVDKQRGNGVFDQSIAALQKLNAIGYGKELAEGTQLKLDLVFNPVGYSLPPDQSELEAAYKQHLLNEYGIVFNTLWTITNMPIKRYEHALKRDGQYDAYMDKLTLAHNACNVSAVMCRDLVSVGWQGSVYDCDFNQMLQMPIVPGTIDAETSIESHELQVESGSRKLWEYEAGELIGRDIQTANHCFGCTAGAGSSCTGALG
jgi:radical SAM/Cys-rich protein